VRSFNEMKGHFYRRGCKCKKKECTCGSKWAFMVDVGIDPVTGIRKQKGKGGLKTKQESETAAAAFIHELEQGTYIEETIRRLVNLQKNGFPSTVKQKM
jgi:hypothetical protein